MRKMNQKFPMTPKKNRVDRVGNDRRKLYFKQGGTTMTLVRNITEGQAKVLENVIYNALEDMNLKAEATMLWKP